MMFPLLKALLRKSNIKTTGKKIVISKKAGIIAGSNIISTKIFLPFLSYSSTLVLDQVMAEDSGQYSCSVENVQGKVETFCKLTVLPKSMNLPLMNDMNGQDNEQPMTIQ